MNVSLTPELERLVNGKVESGMYQAVGEMVRGAIRLRKEPSGPDVGHRLSAGSSLARHHANPGVGC